MSKENIFDIAKKFTDAFFDGLKANAVNNLLAKAKTEEFVTPPLLKKMREEEDAYREMQEILRKLDR